jgi:hypothetical protein
MCMYEVCVCVCVCVHICVSVAVVHAERRRQIHCHIRDGWTYIHMSECGPWCMRKQRRRQRHAWVYT